MSQELPFEPIPFITDPHHQTIISSVINFLLEPKSETKLVHLPDGDKIALEVSTPSGWKPTDPTVLLVHGLCGSHRSPNLVRMVNRLNPLGIRAVRYNMRGCGTGKGLAKNIYHSGRSEDLFESLKLLKKEAPDSPIILVGFSLGANITLKLVGEMNCLGPEYLHAVIAVSPPVDLYASVQMLGDPSNEVYEKYFYKLMRDEVHYRHNKFKDLPPIRLPKNLKIYEFDQLYVAPYSGFSDVMDYYNKCSSKHVVEDICIPGKILFSMDDPIIAPHVLDNYQLPDHLTVYKTRHGGHMGYLTNPTKGKGLFWLDSLLVDWIEDFFKKK